MSVENIYLHETYEWHIFCRVEETQNGAMIYSFYLNSLCTAFCISQRKVGADVDQFLVKGHKVWSTDWMWLIPLNFADNKPPKLRLFYLLA